MSQTFTDFEIVVVDNASTDDTWKACKFFAEKDSRIRVFQNLSNIGPVNNWHRCIQEARGQYGKILFSDDSIYPTFLERTVPLLRNPEVGFVFTAAKIGDDTTTDGTVAYNICPKTDLIDSKLFIESALFENVMPVSPGCALFRVKDLTKNLKLHIPSPGRIDFSAHGAGPDLLLYLLTAIDYPKVACIPDPLSFFRVHSGSITFSEERIKIDNFRRQACIWFLKEYLDEVTFKRYLIKVWLKSCMDHRGWVSPHLELSQFLDEPSRIPSIGEIIAFFLKSNNLLLLWRKLFFKESH